MNLKNELTNLLNKHSIENRSNTPDFILAEFMLKTLELFESTSNARERWNGGRHSPGQGWITYGDIV